MRFGVASISVTGTEAPAGVKSRVTPHLRPSIPMLMAINLSGSIELDLYVDTGREIELHQRVHGLVVRVHDVEHALVGAGLVLIAGVLVGVRRGQNRVAL